MIFFRRWCASGAARPLPAGERPCSSCSASVSTTSTRRSPLIRGLWRAGLVLLGQRSSDRDPPFFVLLGRVFSFAPVSQSAPTARSIPWFLLAAGRPHPCQYQHCDDVLRHPFLGSSVADASELWRTVGDARRPRNLATISVCLPVRSPPEERWGS